MHSAEHGWTCSAGVILASGYMFGGIVEMMNFLYEIWTFFSDRSFLASFFGSLFAGVVLLGTSPIWWKHFKTPAVYEFIKGISLVGMAGVGLVVIITFADWLTNRAANGTRYELVPPDNISSEEAIAIRRSCNLEAEQVYPVADGAFVTNRTRSERPVNRQSYFQRCLQREGFSLRVIEPPENADPE